VLAGGHTLRDEEPLYGLAVVGTVSPDAVWTKAGARAGDLLYLTKPLGTGLIVHGRKEGRVSDEVLGPAIVQMKTLNADIARLLREIGPNAVTDVTGFGLIGHAYEVATRSGVRVELDAKELPVIPAAIELAVQGVATGGDPRNRAYVGDALTVAGASDACVRVAFDPQTAGGLLVALAPERSEEFELGVVERGLFASRIGSVAEGEGVLLTA
jgi:selenide, water dikinase